jgi:hypothetical protein
VPQIAESIQPGDYVVLRTPLQVVSVDNKNGYGPNGESAKFVTISLPMGRADLMTDEGDDCQGDAACLTLEVRASMVGKVSLPSVEEVQLKITDGSPYR